MTLVDCDVTEDALVCRCGQEEEGGGARGGRGHGFLAVRLSHRGNVALMKKGKKHTSQS